MQQYACVEYARASSRAFARRAKLIFDRRFRDVPDSPHKAFLREAVDYCIDREL